MKRLRSLGSGKSKAKTEAAARAAEHSTGQWPTVATLPEEHTSPMNGPLQAQTNSSSADTYVNFSDEEIRAMEESALEYAIQQSQQNSDRYPSSSNESLGTWSPLVLATQHISDSLQMHTPQVALKSTCSIHYQLFAPVVFACCSPSDDAQRQSSVRLPAEPQQMQPQLPQSTRQAQAHAPLQANAQALPETKRKLL